MLRGTGIAENECAYCMAAHTGMAKQENVPEEVIDATRNGTPYADARLEALRKFTRAVVGNRGWVSDEAVEAFLAAGFERRHVLEILVGVGRRMTRARRNRLGVSAGSVGARA